MERGFQWPVADLILRGFGYRPDGFRGHEDISAQRKRSGHFRWHDLRHTFASWWVQGGGDLYRLSRVLGHSTLQMSARYGHLRTDDLHDEMRSLAQKRSQERQIEAGKLPPQPRKAFKRLEEIGAPGTIRTSDPQIRRTTPANDNED
jgi:hypothetical protein